jgi:hypothetical protein
MRVQPRQQLLEVWRAVAKISYQDGQWIWGGRSQRNSISDAEQLLCLLGPATEIPAFKLDLPNETADDIHDALRKLGDPVDIPLRLVKIIAEYLHKYTDETGAPVFPGGTYFTVETPDGMTQGPLTAEQRELDVVDSFAASVRLALGIIGFAKVFRTVLTRQDLRDEVREVETMAKQRLTAGMIGLLRGFAVNVFDTDSKEDTNLRRMVNQTGLPDRRARDLLLQELRDIRAGLRDVSLGISELPELDNENKLFECGWSWGITFGAPQVKTEAANIPQVNGFAEAKPYLYFTVVALDCIRNLFTERTRLLGLLDEEQQRLAGALQIRWDLTQSYWSKLARFGSGRWPLEDMPWRTTDGADSDYFSLLVCSILVQELTNRPDEESTVRVGRVLEELAERARITRRPLRRDPAVTLHHPGFPFPLVGSDNVGGPELTWLLADFSPQLLKQAIRVSSLLRDVERRGRLIELVDIVWESHIRRRQLATANLWDRPAAIYRYIEDDEKLDGLPSWYYTERVVGCLITANDLVSSPPLRSPLLVDSATHLLAEADHIFDQELTRMAADPGPSMRTTVERARAALRRAHEVIETRPGTAAALAAQVLLDLDQLDAARQSANGAG